MAYWLFKQEPTCYSFAQLEQDGSTCWDGVSNALARKHLRSVQPGDRIWFYHTGKEKAVVGEMVASTGPLPDPSDAQGVVVEVKPTRRLSKPVTLAEIKAEPELADWELVRLPRLSVLPVTQAQWQRIEALSSCSST